MSHMDFTGLHGPQTHEDQFCVINIPAEPRQRWQQPGRCIHRVPPHLREDSKELVYDPVVLSIGPYHHGRQEFDKMEGIKDEVLNRFVSDSVAIDAAKDRGFYSKEILESINEVRDNYEHEAVSKYTDVELSEMILRDACFLITYMDKFRWVVDVIRNRLGMSTKVFIDHDVRMLENQIPFWIIKRLLDLRDGRANADALVCKHLSIVCFGDEGLLSRLPWEDEEHQPLHLLEAGRATLLKGTAAITATRTTTTNALDTEPSHSLKNLFNCKKDQEKGNSSAFKYVSLPFRSVTYLKAKGVFVEPSTNCLKDIEFTSGSCCGILRVPTGIIATSTKGLLSNLIAFEMSAGNPHDQFTVTSYVNFMKSLIESAKDVKELREKSVLFSTMVNDEEVVKVFQEIHTYGLDDYDSFAEVKRGIDEHCSSMAKTWMAELISIYFRSPWTVIALFVATLILCLTLLQTVFTIHPLKKS